LTDEHFPSKSSVLTRCCEKCGAVMPEDQEECAYCENCEQAMRVASRVIGIDRWQKRLVLE